jgi:hypothetical protein
MSYDSAVAPDIPNGNTKQILYALTFNATDDKQYHTNASFFRCCAEWVGAMRKECIEKCILIRVLHVWLNRKRFRDPVSFFVTSGVALSDNSCDFRLHF